MSTVLVPVVKKPQVVLVRCPNADSFHNCHAVSYMLFIDNEGYWMWWDDPTPEQVRDLLLSTKGVPRTTHYKTCFHCHRKGIRGLNFTAV